VAPLCVAGFRLLLIVSHGSSFFSLKIAKRNPADLATGGVKSMVRLDAPVRAAAIEPIPVQALVTSPPKN
jgi:hypothetical protein